MNKQKNKGKTFEREIAKFLSELTGKSFTRVPNSGAFIGGKNIKRINTLTNEQINLFSGDIIVPEEWNHVLIECKSYKKISWASLFSQTGDSIVNSWIQQAQSGCKKIWFVIFKINNLGIYVIYEKNLNYNILNSYMNYLDKYIIVRMNDFFYENWMKIENEKY